jgi:hypothetical protein
MYSPEKYSNMHFVNGFWNGNAKAVVEEYQTWQSEGQILDQYVFIFHQYIQENGSLQAVNHHTKHEVQWNVKGKENITGIIQQSPGTSTQIFLTVSLLHAWESEECYTKDSIHTYQVRSAP